MRRGEDEVAVLCKRVYSVSDRVEFYADELKFFDASFYLTLIFVATDMRAKAGQTEESAWILCAEFGDFVVAMDVIPSAGKRLHDGGVNSALIHALDHIFLGTVKAEDAALAEMCVGINYLRHLRKLLVG
jgi:hypothetical protein